jgi:RNA polymerase-binding transcription factor DksA
VKPDPEEHLRDAAFVRACRRRVLDKGAEIAKKLAFALAGLEVDLNTLKLPEEKEPGLTPVEKLRRYLDLLERSRRSFDDGTWGRCVSCGTVLTLVQLDAMPWAEHCQKCAAAGRGF